MPARDSERYIAEALHSVLAQSMPPREIVVVDDGSRDGTPEILASFGDAIRVVTQEPRGIFEAQNHAIAATDAPVLAFLDADDLFTPRSLEVRLRRLDAPDAPEAVFGRTQQFVSPELGPEDAARFRFDPGPVHGELFQAMLIRRDAFDRVGELDTDLRTCSNVDWVFRSRAVGLRAVEIDDVVARRRLHGANFGIVAAEEKRRELVEVVRRHSRRASPGPAPR